MTSERSALLVVHTRETTGVNVAVGDDGGRVLGDELDSGDGVVEGKVVKVGLSVFDGEEVVEE
jgi:hypothetical protein